MKIEHKTPTGRWGKAQLTENLIEVNSASYQIENNRSTGVVKTLELYGGNVRVTLSRAEITEIMDKLEFFERGCQQ